MPRLALVAVAALTLAGCTDVREFDGAWSGRRVGDAAPLRVGVASDATAALDIDTIDTHGLAATLSVDGLVDGARLTSLEGAEADVLAGMTFDGSPLRVYLAFVATVDDGGDALTVLALHDDRIEIRLLRGGAAPIYAVFSLRRP